MRIRPTALLAAALAVLPVARAEIRDRPVPGTAAPPRPSPAMVSSSSALPAEFEENRGQTDPSVRFVARPRGYRAFFADGETVFVLPRGGDRAPDPRDPGPRTPPATDAVRMRFEGARNVRPAAGLPLPGRSNYFIGNDPSRWVRDVPHHADIGARGLYDGVDVRWRGIPGGRLEYDILLAPGTDPGSIALRFEGARSVATDGEGRLLVTTEGGVLRHSRPVAYQDVGSRRRPVEAGFVIETGSRVRIALGARDPRLPVVIDPEIDYSTFLGGSYSEYVTCLGSDGTGSFYAGGQVTSLDFPVLNAPPGAKGSNYDAFATKFNPSGSALVWSTYLGGSDSDYGAALAVGTDGSAVICGNTPSVNFPTATPLQVSNAGMSEGFITKIGSAGNTLSFSTYLGGASNDQIRGVALASDGSAVVAGYTLSSAFPTTASAYQKTIAGQGDVFVSRLSAAGTALAWSTYLGGASQDEAFAVAVDASDQPVVAGVAYSTNFPTASPLQASNGGAGDAFVAKFASNGSSLVWSTYFGGSQNDYGFGVSLASDGRVWIAGETSSDNLPVTGAYQSTRAGAASDAFVARIAANGSAVQMASYLGGTGSESASGIVVDKDGSAFMVGITDSTNFPLSSALQANRGSYFDYFLAQFPATGASLPFSTYIGGNGDDRCYAVAVDVQARVAVGGYTNGASNTFPIVNAYDGTLGGTLDGTVTVIKRLPFVPNDLSAALASLTSVELLWTDTAVGESAFRLERSVNGVDFSTLADAPANATSYIDGNLAPATTYYYRIRTVAGAYVSEPSEAVSIDTPMTPTFVPAAPTNLVATVADPRRVNLTWQDNSDNEDFFVVARASGTGLYATLSTPRINATAGSDLTPLPGRTYSYKLRGVNPTGSSLDSNIETLTMPSTLVVTLAKGRIVDKESPYRDSVAASGLLAYGPDALAAAFDPAEQGISVRLGSLEGPALLDVAKEDPGWKLRRGKWSWKSPRGSLTKAKVTVVPETGAWTVALSHLTLAAPAENPIRITLTAGTDEGHEDADWTAPTRGGTRKFPVPAPK